MKRRIISSFLASILFTIPVIVVYFDISFRIQQRQNLVFEDLIREGGECLEEVDGATAPDAFFREMIRKFIFGLEKVILRNGSNPKILTAEYFRKNLEPFMPPGDISIYKIFSEETVKLFQRNPRMGFPGKMEKDLIALLKCSKFEEGRFEKFARDMEGTLDICLNPEVQIFDFQTNAEKNQEAVWQVFHTTSGTKVLFWFFPMREKNEKRFLIIGLLDFSRHEVSKLIKSKVLRWGNPRLEIGFLSTTSNRAYTSKGLENQKTVISRLTRQKANADKEKHRKNFIFPFVLSRIPAITQIM